MRVALAFAVLVLAGCSSGGASYVNTVQLPMDDAIFGADGTIHAVAVLMSFEVDGETHGDLGSHCGYDRLGHGPSLLLQVGEGGSAPDHVVLRLLDPDQDTSQIANFGTAMYIGDDTIHASMDRDVELGTITWDPPRFKGMDIRSDAWLQRSFAYTVDGTDGPVHVVETLHLRDLGDIPVTLDQEDKMCF